MAKKNNFQEVIEEHLINFKIKHQFLPSPNSKKNYLYHDYTENLFPPIKHSFIQYLFDNPLPLHDYVNHVRSSQMFGINLFYPFLLKENTVLVSLFSKLCNFAFSKLVDYTFELSPPKDWLGEWKGEDRPDEYVTSCDVAITFEDKFQKKYKVLIEVKFSEDEFGECNGFKSNGNRKDNSIYAKTCMDREILNKNSQLCFLQNKNSSRSARKYFDYFPNIKSSFSGNEDVTDCPFKNNHQCLRNHSFLKALEIEEDYEKCFFGLAYHDDNVEIIKHWNRYYNLVSDELKKDLFCVKASEIIENSANDILKEFFRAKYKLC